MADLPTVALVSLGCAKNLVDSEKMLGQLAEAGCAITPSEDLADVIVVNTCGFLEASRTEADDVIREAVERKTRGEIRRVVVAGCLPQRDNTSLLDRIEGIDALVGVNNRDDVVAAVMGSTRESPARATDVFLSDYHPFVQLDTARLRLTPRHYAYLRISEGCDQKCTFCTIPAIRGRMHCKPPAIILHEARELVGDGAVEISLIGQDTTSYGLGDDQLDVGLAGLLRQLNDLDGLAWIRLMYAYPSVFTEEMIDAIASCDRVCNYIDIPLQHINDRMLKAMHRRVDRASTVRLLEKIRERIPGVTIRTTLIAGFPGETDAEFEELCQFVREFRFDALGVFAYSQEPDTPAGRMKGQLSEAQKNDRVNVLMTTQQEVAFELADEQTGKTFDVLIDGRDESGILVGRHEGQAPTVDSVTLLESCEANAGQFVNVRCLGRDDYDLVATPTTITLPVLNP
ncbi:MAG: 30S ribosomal protein S12 methylthiotransferase RimO [Phycisphaerae bacterium]